MPTKTKSTTARGGRTSTQKQGTGSQKRSGNGHSAKPMVENLEDAFLVELADMLHAEREFGKILPKLATAATSRRLREALEWHAEQTEEQATRLEHVFQVFGRKPEAEVCEGMQGIITECRELLQKTGPDAVRDAMIIAATQKAGHYEIAAYGTLCAWADELREGHALRLLEDTLREKRGADRTLTRIAESFSNPQADRGEGRYGRDDRGYAGERGFGRSGEEWRRREFADQGPMRGNEPGARYEDRFRGGSGRGRGYDE